MYVRPPHYRYPNGMRVPENYSGNTFRESAPEDEAEPNESVASELKNETSESELPVNAEPATETASLLHEPPRFRLGLSPLFSKLRGIGTEELLILALILLLADSEDNEDLILFLAILFFIK